jgi:hypothetical protein
MVIFVSTIMHHSQAGFIIGEPLYSCGCQRSLNYLDDCAAEDLPRRFPCARLVDCARSTGKNADQISFTSDSNGMEVEISREVRGWAAALLYTQLSPASR